jgi:hypothetical protein
LRAFPVNLLNKTKNLREVWFGLKPVRKFRTKAAIYSAFLSKEPTRNLRRRGAPFKEADRRADLAPWRRPSPAAIAKAAE